jgi:hypothetical protein
MIWLTLFLIPIAWFLIAYYRACKLEKLREYDRNCEIEAMRKERNKYPEVKR